MADKFHLLYFTPETGNPADIARGINDALGWGGFDLAHLRMPGASEAELAQVIELVRPDLRSRLTLHDHFSMAAEAGIGGLQLNSRNPEPPAGWSGRLSLSCHSMEEAEREVKKYDYVTLSPVFPSISKPGYQKDFTGLGISCRGIVALGGITAANLQQVRAMGFSCAAVKGWLETDYEEFCARLRRLKMLARGEFSLQYITNGSAPEEVAGEVADVLSEGCRWVQIRMKDAPDQAVREAAGMVVPMCRRVGAVCLLDDRVHLVQSAGADGVHLGKSDMSPAAAREILGREKIIGSTANTIADIQSIAALEASDYIGLGPYRFTTTKRRLSPVLGLEGYREIFSRLEDRQMPVVAIGGIEVRDVAELLHAGANGVAVSGAIFSSPDRQAATEAFIRAVSETK